MTNLIKRFPIPYWIQMKLGRGEIDIVDYFIKNDNENQYLTKIGKGVEKEHTGVSKTLDALTEKGIIIKIHDGCKNAYGKYTDGFRLNTKMDFENFRAIAKEYLGHTEKELSFIKSKFVKDSIGMEYVDKIQKRLRTNYSDPHKQAIVKLLRNSPSALWIALFSPEPFFVEIPAIVATKLPIDTKGGKILQDPEKDPIGVNDHYFGGFMYAYGFDLFKYVELIYVPELGCEIEIKFEKDISEKQKSQYSLEFYPEKQENNLLFFNRENKRTYGFVWNNKIATLNIKDKKERVIFIPTPQIREE